MAENNVEAEDEWTDWTLDTAEDTLVAMETLLATLRAFEDVLRQQDISTASSTEYCDNFCQALMHYAGSRNSVEHGLALLEVYCLSINCFAAARSHLTAESDKVALVLKRLALSCFELLLSVPENEIPYEAWVQFHHSVQIAHDTLLQYGSTDLQALLQITGEGGAWSNPVLSSLITGQTTNPEEVNMYISLEGEGFMEMRVKHLEKMGEVAKAVVLAKACTECSFISNQAMFRQMYISLLCHLLPNEEAIMEISRLDCRDVLEITCNLETEGEENTAFILCTTFLTQQLQQQSLCSSWELTLQWSKLQRRLDPSLVSLLERCLQLAAIAKTVHHLLYLVRVIQTEAEELGTPASVELCVKALQLPKGDDSETRISVCKTMSCLLQGDLEVSRACQLTEFLLGPTQESFRSLKELYLCPDQKYDQESETIPNSLRCELLLALKAYWPFDPEYWDWKTLKFHCMSLLGLKPQSDIEEEEAADRHESMKPQEPHAATVKVESRQYIAINGGFTDFEQQHKKLITEQNKIKRQSEVKKTRLCCQICRRCVSDSRIVHHSKRHAGEKLHPCPVCKDKFKSRKELVPHLKKHIQNEANVEVMKNKSTLKHLDDDNDIEPGEITVDPSLMLYYKSTHDPDVLHHIVEQAATVKEKTLDDDEYITFDYINRHFKLQNRDVYPCPGTGCTRVFKHSKYLYVHLKSEHSTDNNVKYFHQIRDKREKCVFCRRHFVSAYHHRRHRRVHYGDRPYTCVVIGCGAQFSTSNELVTHKQTHGFQLNYQCELKGCYITYSDLGQIYHHEAQHFRDAAFTCSSSECKQYHFSKKDFIRHLATHNITFSESDFEAQRKAKQKLFKMVPESAPHLRSFNLGGLMNGEDLHSGNCVTTWQSRASEPKATMTLVAVCFDGSKFTCGFEKCGMTFSRARDVQRHLKCAHTDHLKMENKEYKHDKEHDCKSIAINTELKLDLEKNLLLAPLDVNEERKGTIQPKSSDAPKNDPLKELLIGLSRLNLNSTSSHNLPREFLKANVCSHSSKVAFHQAIMAKTPVVLLQKRPHLSAGLVSAKEDSLPLLGNAKPYVCQVNTCGFRTAQSYSLLRHYNTRHGHTLEQAKRLTSLKTTCFKPYVCQLCSKSHRQKNVLRSHYIQVHKLSPTSVESMICTSGVTSQKTQSPHHSLNGKKHFSQAQCDHRIENSMTINDNEQKFDTLSMEDEDGERRPEDDEQEGNKDDRTTQVRTRRLVAKSNLCYILDKFSKPFHCVAKNCDAAFSTQGGLVRHLQLIHHYNRSQLLLEKDIDVQCTSEVRKEQAKKRPPPNSDEPQPQFKCHFANCSASYHLKSSLVRHTRDYHSQPPGLICCTFDGCTRVFSHNEALKKHTLHSHYEYYDSLVVRLQSTHKKSITGCQKKLIVPPENQDPNSFLTQPEHSHPTAEVMPETQEGNSDKVKKRKKNYRHSFSSFVFRSHEEALQMCQDRCLRVAFPCMIQDCDSVVTYTHSLNRHYLKVHHMHREDLAKNQKKLVFNAEQLEELIQRMSARPTMMAGAVPNGVCKLECQVEQENTSLHSPKSRPLEEDDSALEFPEECKVELPPVERSGVFVAADEVLYGKASTNGHTNSSSSQNAQKPEERLSLDKITPLLRPLTVDLSPARSLHFTAEEGLQESPINREGSKMLNGSLSFAALPLRQPLKRKNELSELPSNLKDPQAGSRSTLTFDIATYKPIGFESSFLKFIQDTTQKDNSCMPARQRDTLRRNCSVKENNHLGISQTRSKRTHSPLLKSLTVAGDLASVRNLKFILDKALDGCGDLAIKQLHYLRPVVVLGRPVNNPKPPHLFPSDITSSKLFLGS